MEFKSFQIRAFIYSIFPYNLVYISINTNPVFMQGSFFFTFLSPQILSKPSLSLSKPF
nr:MAG TPA: hypothetical protein [Caudoviricetes sp.]